MIHNPQKQVQSCKVPAVSRLELVTTIECVHEDVQCEAAKITIVQTSLETATRVETEKNKWKDVEYKNHEQG